MIRQRELPHSVRKDLRLWLNLICQHAEIPSRRRDIYIARIQTAIRRMGVYIKMQNSSQLHTDARSFSVSNAAASRLILISRRRSYNIAHVDSPMDNNTFWQQLRATSVKALGSKLQLPPPFSRSVVDENKPSLEVSLVLTTATLTWGRWCSEERDVPGYPL